MSNIYVQEPPTSGKVLLVTTVGDIDIELWSKEAPKACRNFVQLCMEGYYDGTIFHRVVKDFIVQGGDPTGTGQGGESIYDKPFKDEFHQRLRFVRRGLVAMANSAPNDNGSQFFFTMGSTPELLNKHTIFGKVSGNTVYNMLKLQDGETDGEDRPLFPNKIIKTLILSNPFEDIIPRANKKIKKDVDIDKKKSKSKATKNFKLLSFGEEAEEDEEQVKKVAEGWKGKSKSSHDLANDPRLSTVPAIDVSPSKLDKSTDSPDNESDDEMEDEIRENVKKKLKRDPGVVKEAEVKQEPPEIAVVNKPTSRSEELKQESKKLIKEIQESKRRTEQMTTEVVDESVEEEPASNDPLADFKRERLKYKLLRKQHGQGSLREDLTLSLLDKFKSKLSSARTLAGNYSDEDEKLEEEDKDEDVMDLSWMHHKLNFEEQKKKVIDANINDVDRYEIHDPRNPLTKRRREESKLKMKNKR